MSGADGWTRREKGALAALLCGGLALRLVYIAEYVRALPFVDGPVGDSPIYLEQAFHVARGEFGDATLLALSPLYGYWLFLLGAPEDLLTPLAFQLLFGIASTAMLFSVVRARFGLWPAVASGFLFSFYGAVLFLESKVLSDSLGLVLIIGAQGVLLSEGFRRGRIGPSVAAGVLAGLAILARASLIFCGPLLILAAVLPWATEAAEPRPAPLRARLRRTGLLTVGLGMVLLFNGVWTQHHSGLFVPVVLVSQTLERATASADAGGSRSIHELAASSVARPYDVVVQARERLAREAAGEVTTASASIDLAAWLGNLPHKLPGTFSNRERTFQYGYLGERSMVRTLDLLPVCFGLLLLWGSVGAAFVVRRNGAAALVPYLPLFLGAVACTTLYHPSTRYRLAMVVPLVLLAGPGLVAALRGWGTPRGKAFVVGAALLSLVAIGHHYSLTLKNHAAWELQLATSAAIAGERGEALRHLDAAAAHAPDDPRVQAQVEGMRQAVGRGFAHDGPDQPPP